MSLFSSDNGAGISGIVDSEHVKVMSLKALGGNDGSGTTESIIKAIRYAEANGASSAVPELTSGITLSMRKFPEACINGAGSR